ncbi:hypothetical protein NPIL_639401 [Nephila pilipes]|uniref:Uncharacterized protein n=1 Tax=Nephila pilipes TaxID=299642 RepID=A0A8X6MA33_NEPPI|nr:hypothetical protein NPIL_639401 [Nephila pilipes]
MQSAMRERSAQCGCQIDDLVAPCYPLRITLTSPQSPNDRWPCTVLSFAVPGRHTVVRIPAGNRLLNEVENVLCE